MSELVSLRVSDNAEVSVILLHHAGGGVNYYREWLEYFPNNFDLFAIRLPGRETLYSKPPYKNLEAVLADVEKVLEPVFLEGNPTFIFGHSMGGMIAFEIARLYSEKQKINGLFISGFGHPSLTKKIDRSRFDDSELRINMNYSDIEESPYVNELLEVILPTLKNDYAICDSYQYIKKDKLSIPIIVFGGLKDKIHSPKTIEKWCDETNVGFSSFYYPGGHFFIKESFQSIIDDILKNINFILGSRKYI